MCLWISLKRICKIKETPRARNNVRLMRMAFRYADLEIQQENAESMDYQGIREYPHTHPELLYMT